MAIILSYALSLAPEATYQLHAVRVTFCFLLIRGNRFWTRLILGIHLLNQRHLILCNWDAQRNSALCIIPLDALLWIVGGHGRRII